MIEIVRRAYTKRGDSTGEVYGIRGYRSAADRDRACKAMLRRSVARGMKPINRFVFFKDAQAEFAVQYMHDPAVGAWCSILR